MNRKDRATAVLRTLVRKWDEARAVYTGLGPRLTMVRWWVSPSDGPPSPVEKTNEELTLEFGEGPIAIFGGVAQLIASSDEMVSEVGIGVQWNPSSNETEYFGCGFREPI